MPTTGYADHDVQVGDLRLHYQEWGDPNGPAILMVHGFGVSGHMFDEFAGRLQDRFRLIAVDQRGHGDSDWSESGDYSRDAFVDDLEGFREALGLKTFVLVGHSMGGLNSVAYTVRHPERVRALVLVDVGPESAKEGVDNIKRFTSGPDELEFDEFVEMAMRFNKRRTRENIEDRMRHRLRQMENGKWTWKFDKRFREKDNTLRIGSQMTNDEGWQLYRAVPVPTLLIRGAESDVLTQEIAERVAREMRRARLVVIPGAGHSVPGDNPDEFTAAVSGFVDDVAAGRFEPEAATEPPPLERLVEVQEASRRRRPGTLTMLLVGAGALAVVAGAFFARGKAKSRAEERRRQQERRIAGVRLPSGGPSQDDLDQARQRAADLVSQLSVVGRDGVERARRTVRGADVTQARQSALALAQQLEERARHAPDTVRTAVSSVDRKQLRRGSGKAAKKGRSAAGTAFSAALRASGLRQKEPKLSRRERVAARLPWRS